MRPHTRFQHKVAAVNERLSPISGTQKQWGFRNALKHYAIRNAKSGEFIVIDDVRSETPFRRYMHLEKSVKNDSALWTIGQQSDGSFYFQSVAAPNYCFNLRTSNYALRKYSFSFY